MKWGDHFRDRSTGVTFETKDFKVTAACAFGCTESSHLEMSECRMKLLLPDANYSVAEIIAEEKQILPEDELPIDQMQGQERSAGSSPHGSLKAACRKRMSGTSKDRTDKDGQGETCFSDSLPPRGIRSSRRRPRKERKQLPARKNTKTAEVEKVTSMLKNGKKRAEVAQEETTQSLIPTPVRIVMLAIFVFVIFVHVVNGG
ncbi:uncharacterized protein LOC135316963 [Phalacrocorax carbo]|uniref:uncharacterized protein LOC135316963 n=1 Tax=Phalacrocorax carbo TaxID=9209 RepID=UPI00311968A3